MKLTVQRIMDVLPVVTAIINENRPMPQKGKYRLARLHAKLLSEYATASAQRDAMIKAYNFPHVTDSGPTGEFTVPSDRVAEFNADWAEVAKEEIEVDLQPIPFAHIDLGDGQDGSITAAELVILGDLVSE